MDRVLASEAEDRSSSLREGTQKAASTRLFCSKKLSHAHDLNFRYNRFVYHKNISLFIVTILVCTGCSGKIKGHSGFTATPDFFTATLPPTLTPQPTQVPQTLSESTPVPSAVKDTNLPPVEGMTTTQINVRAATSTASQSLGMIGQFVKVQVIGKDSSGSWYQVMYAESGAGKGWVRAEYVQVNAPAEIQLVETTSGSGAGVSGLVIQKINVRKGPGIEYELLGVLNSNDVVFITGKDTSGAWIQIEFAGAPDGKGWVTAEFLQVGNIEGVPLIGVAANETPTPTVAAPESIEMLAVQDGDSMQAPLAAAVFAPTGSRTLQVNGDVSAPDGDVEDWIQFSTYGEVVAIQAACSSNTLRVELWNNGKPADDFLLSCGGKSFMPVAANSSYFLRLSEASVNDAGYTNYILSVESIR